VPTSGGGGKATPELDLLSNILSSFHDLFGDIPWKDEDRVKNHIVSIPDIVLKDKAYKNAMKNSDKRNAKLESEEALNRAIIDIMADNMELFKQYNDNPSFKKWLGDLVFNITYYAQTESS